MDKLPVDIATCECLRLGTDEVVILASGEQTGGALFAVQLRMPPGGGPPVMHRHEPSEVYSVISGELTFYVGDDPVERVVAGLGDVVPLAGWTPHTIRNEADVDAVAFGVHAPAGPMEAFTRAAHALTADGEPRMEDVLEVAARHGIELLGPVPVTR
ncbi:cupin domain-containing protein [Actinomycetospora lutea]|uniref:cupin domain-containing protein n=1 Tax=Actinomycetospora lutea TaxID=663604 RepID=UPI002365D6EB|nr:cupin domain-containing protein [Actinomycetospora lutea]MDD7939210.1 cupin domain-containing protein [Actinomycetospora lutea]